MKGNILILSNNLNGLYSFRKEVIQAIKNKGYEVYISIPDADSSRISYFKEMGCHIEPISFDRRGVNPLADIKLMLQYRKLMRKNKPKAVLTYTIKPNVYGGMAARLCGIPQLANVTGLGDAIENGGWMQKLTIALYKIGIGKAQCVFFQNKTNQEFCIKNGITGKKTQLLPGSGVNLKHHVFQDYPEDGTIRFLYVGRIMKDKGSEELFKAAQVIKEKYPNTAFDIVGSVQGDYQEQLDDLVDKGIVNFLGHQDDVRPFIGKAHCCVMPSYHEGMSNVNLESAANGRPVITTDVPGCREAVDNGKTGYLIEARSADSLIKTLVRFIALPYTQKVMMCRNGREKVEKEFDRQMVIEAYLKEID